MRRLVVLPLRELRRRAGPRRDGHAPAAGAPPGQHASPGVLTIDEALARQRATEAEIARAQRLYSPFPRRDVCPHGRGDVCTAPARALDLVVESLQILRAYDGELPPAALAVAARLRRAALDLGGRAALRRLVDVEEWAPLDDPPVGAVHGACPRCGGGGWFLAPSGNAVCGRCGDELPL